MTTPYHAKYYAAELTKRCSSHQLGKLNQSIFNATVDLNHHQIDAALFAFRSPVKQTANLDAKVEFHKKAKDLERRRNEKRKALFDAQDEIDRKKETLIGKIEAKLKQSVKLDEVITIRWRVK